MTSIWRYRHPLLHGWWIAVAQNVAPRRFHAHEQRIRVQENREMLASCDIPTFALVGGAGGLTPEHPEPQVAGGIGTVGEAGERGRRRPRHFSATTLTTAQETADGGWVRCTSHRGSGVETDDRQRSHLVHNFVARAGLADDPRVERRGVVLPAARMHDLLAVPENAWRPVAVTVGARRYEFEGVTIDRHWLALGEVDGVSVAIEGHGLDPVPLDLRRVARQDA
jgi:hypothetical protein